GRQRRGGRLAAVGRRSRPARAALHRRRRRLIDLVADVLARLRAVLVHQLELERFPAGLRVGVALLRFLFELFGLFLAHLADVLVVLLSVVLSVGHQVPLPVVWPWMSSGRWCSRTSRARIVSGLPFVYTP